MRVHQNTRGRVSQARKWVQKQNDNISYFWFKWLIGMDAGRYADDRQCSLSVHVQWFSHQNDGADYHDIIKGHHENLSCVKGREV